MNGKVFMLWMSVGHLPCLDVRCMLVCVSLDFDGIRIWNTLSGGRSTSRVGLGA